MTKFAVLKFIFDLIHHKVIKFQDVLCKINLEKKLFSDVTVRRKNVRVRLGTGLIRKYPRWNGGHSVHTSNVPFVNKVSYYSQREGTLLSTLWSQTHYVTDIKQCCKMNVPNHWQFDCLFQRFRLTIKRKLLDPLTKGQYCRKRFHVKTPSCYPKADSI